MQHRLTARRRRGLLAGGCWSGFGGKTIKSIHFNNNRHRKNRLTKNPTAMARQQCVSRNGRETVLLQICIVFGEHNRAGRARARRDVCIHSTTYSISYIFCVCISTKNATLRGGAWSNTNPHNNTSHAKHVFRYSMRRSGGGRGGGAFRRIQLSARV